MELTFMEIPQFLLNYIILEDPKLLIKIQLTYKTT